MTCRHENIYWEDFFKPEKQNNYQYRHKNAYCMDCDAKKGHNFAVRCQLWYAEKVREWLKSNGLTKLYTLNNEEIHSYNDFEEFIDNNNYRKQWNKLQSGGVDPNYFDGFGGQSLFFETARSIEHLCQEFKKEKEQEIPNDRERERERERESKLAEKLRD